MGCVLYLLCAMCAATMNSALMSTVSSLLSVMCVVHGTGDRLYESFATVGEIRVWWRAYFQSGSRVLKKVF